jgi:hypothetical protein
MIDLDEVRKVVEGADVFTIGFRTFPERLIIDTRVSDSEGAMIEVVEPVPTVEERFFWLGQRRPSFGVPERFTFFVWPHSIRYFEDSGLCDMIRRRIASVDAEADAQIQGAVHELFTLEHRANMDAIRGVNYHALWERSDN